MNLQLNDWNFKNFSILVFSLILAFIGFIFLDLFGIHMPFLRGILGFILITFIPGFIILRILKLHELGTVYSVLFSVGLSLSFTMILGVFLNLMYPLIGIKSVFSSFSFSLVISVSMIILLCLAVIPDRNYSPAELTTSFNDYFKPYVLMTLLMPFLAIIGVSFMNLWNTNIILLIFILIVSLVPIFVAFRKIPSLFYPFLIFSVSIALLYHVSLFSNHLVGSDIFSEIFFANTTAFNHFWDNNYNHQLNALLSVTVLPAVYNAVCNVEPLWYFKLISPFFFSLVPVGLYQLYNSIREIDEKEKFLAVFLIIGLSQFYALMSGRSQVAELFYVLLLLVMFSPSFKKKYSYNILLIIFTVSLIFSQYSLALLFAIFILIFLIINHFITKNSSDHHFQNLLGLNYLLLFLAISLGWNMYVANGSVFKAVVYMGDRIFNSFDDLFNPQTNVSLSVTTSTSLNILHDIYRYIYYFVLLSLAIGGLSIVKKIIYHGIYYENRIVMYILKNLNLMKHIKKPEKSELTFYSLFAFSNYVLLFIYVVIPLIGFQFGLERVLHITLLVLAPYFIIGFRGILFTLQKIAKILLNLKFIDSKGIKVISIFLSVLFLFNSGFVFEVSHDPYPNSVPLSLKNLNDPIDMEHSEGMMYLRIHTVTDSELSSGQWFVQHYDRKQRVYSSFGNVPFAIFGVLPPYTSVFYITSDHISNIYKGYYFETFLQKIFKIDVSKGLGTEQVQKMNSSNNLSYLNKIYSSSQNDIYSENV